MALNVCTSGGMQRGNRPEEGVGGFAEEERGNNRVKSERDVGGVWRDV